MPNFRKDPKKILENVSPDKIFFVCDGSTLSNIKDLSNALKTMNDGTFSYHANQQKNDFSNWITDVLHDPALGKKIRYLNKVNTQKEIEKRIRELEKKLK
ncbi:MAG: DUF5752 family protein [Candidatus Woesearchaeota archaeon]